MAEPDENTQAPRRPSALLLIAGVFAIALSIWVLVGPSTWHGAGHFPFGWVLVIGAVVVGAALIRRP